MKMFRAWAMPCHVGCPNVSLISWAGRFPAVYLRKKSLSLLGLHIPLIMQSVGLKCSWMMKKQAFFWPLGRVFKKLGGVPIDRGAADDVIPQIANWLKSQDKAYLGLTPEGTRSKVDVYKRGYLRIANAAHVPVFLVGVDAIHKRVVLDKIWPLTGDIDVDNRNIKAYYDANFKGIRAHLA